jgi:hypothetical protein
MCAGAQANSKVGARFHVKHCARPAIHRRARRRVSTLPLLSPKTTALTGRNLGFAYPKPRAKRRDSAAGDSAAPGALTSDNVQSVHQA